LIAVEAFVAENPTMTEYFIESAVSEREFARFLEELIESDRFEGAEIGVAKMVIHGRYSELSDKQLWVLQNSVEQYVTKDCKCCGVTIPWSEMYHAIDNGGLCFYCWKKFDD
jgi:hypothetical protein